MIEAVTLVPVDATYAGDLRAMVLEYCDAGEAHVYQGDFAAAVYDVPAFIELLQRMRSGGYPRPDIVPMESYLIWFGEQLAGEISVRARLSEPLLRVGGHIGYKIRPSLRGLGIAKTALSLALARLDELGVATALLTCDESNATSARVIEANGGVRIMSLCDRVRRYDVSTSATARPPGGEPSLDAEVENARRAKPKGREVASQRRVPSTES